MNFAHIHLIINHIPLLTIPLGLIFYSYGLYNDDHKLQRFSLIVLIATAAAAVPVYLTGEPAEKIVERLPGVIESAIEAHEDAAQVSLIVTVLAGFVALIALIFSPLKKLNLPLTKAVVVTCLVAVASLGYTSYLGGKIRHSELQSAVSANRTVSPAGDFRDDD